MARTRGAGEQCEKTMSTLWGLMYEGLPETTRQRLETWLGLGPQGRAIAENFGNYVKVGFLFACPVIIELYSWFTEFRRKDKGTMFKVVAWNSSSR